MKITRIWEKARKPTLSFELFPARSPKAADKLESVIDELAALGPDFVSVTFGAGGSTREGSRQLVEKLAKGKGLEVVAYFACVGLGPSDIRSVIDDYRAIGIDNVLAVRGDAPRDDESYRPHPESLEHASDLVAFLRPLYPDVCIGVAGYPEGHIEASSRERDLEYLALKVGNGADYVITNYCYDTPRLLGFLGRCREASISVPVLPGVMPIFSVKMMQTLASICGATITDEIREGLAGLPEGDQDAVADFGVEVAVRQCRDLIRAGAPGLHIYTMDRSRSAVEIVARLRDEGLL